MSKIRKAARMQDCQLQIFPYCEFLGDTTVLAHMPSPDSGIALKSPDWWASFACNTCHDIADGRRKVDLSTEEILNCKMRGIYRTQKILIELGLISV